MSVATPGRVLLVSIYYAPELTGIGINNVAMAESLAQSGYDVEVVTGMPHFPEWRIHAPYRGKKRMTETIESVRVHRFPHYVPRRHWAGSRAMYELSFLASASRHKVDSKPDAIIAIVPPLAAGFIARRYALRSGVPWGLIFSDLTGRAALQSGMPGGKIVAGQVSSVELRLARSATAVGVIADGFIPYLESGGVPRDRIHRIVNTNQVGRNRTSVERNTMRERLGWKDGEFVVLYTGNIAFKQALETVIHAARVLSSTPRFRFVLMGDGNQREVLQRLTRKLSLRNVEFVAPADSADYPSILAAADILLLHQRASVTDMSLPGKVSNYFASGTPVVAGVADGSVAADEMRRSKGALLIPPEDTDALVSAIKRLADDPVLRQQLASDAGTFEAARIQSAITFDARRFLQILLSHGVEDSLKHPRHD